jgi:DNA-binding CsgD family transcriptional regulator
VGGEDQVPVIGPGEPLGLALAAPVDTQLIEQVRAVPEAEVLRLIAQGRSNAEIAAELFLGVETVKTHVRNVLAKLGARDRVQAVITAFESGFIR